MPSSGRPKAQKKRTTDSGVLRNVVTHTAPNRCSGGTGETRHAAISTPSTSDPTSEYVMMRRDVRNPSTYRSRFWVTASTRAPSRFWMGGTGGRDRGRPGNGRPRSRDGSGAGRGLGQRGRLGALDLAGGGLPGLGVGVGVGRERLVDELAERDVPLGDADAVGLLGELLADQLECAV